MFVVCGDKTTFFLRCLLFAGRVLYGCISTAVFTATRS